MRRSGLAVLFWVGLFFGCSSVNAEEGPPAPVLFSDPDQTVTKPEAWQTTPIRYEEWAKGADIAATLDQHLYHAFLPVIKGYAARENLDIALREGTCGTSEGLLNHKRVDVAGFCCPPGVADRLPGLTFHTLGIASLVILVNQDNPVTNLSAEQVRAIFQGRLTDWNQIEPGPGQERLHLPIRPIGRFHCKTRPGHWRSILDNEDLFSSSLMEVGTIHNMIASVSEYRGAIGYEVLWSLRRFKGHLNSRSVSVDGIDPTDQEAVARGAYPFYRVYNVTVWNDPSSANAKATAFVDHLLAHGTDIEKNMGFVPVSMMEGKGWKFRDRELIGAP